MTLGVLHVGVTASVLQSRLVQSAHMSILAAVLLASGCYKNVWHTALGLLAAKMRDAVSLGIVYIAQVQYEGNLADAHRTGLCRHFLCLSRPNPLLVILNTSTPLHIIKYSHYVVCHSILDVLYVREGGRV